MTASPRPSVADDGTLRGPALSDVNVAGSDGFIELRAVTKHFGNVVALDNVTLDVAAAEVHAILGQNGAGKTTLMNILTGLYRPDSGDIWVDGRHIHLVSTRAANDVGIQMVHQHFMLVDAFTAAENMVLGHERKTRIGLLDRKQMVQELTRLGREYGMPIDPMMPVRLLSVGERQRLEILKALYRDFRLLILDEPTAVLSPLEVKRLLDTVRVLRQEGRSVILITHKLREVLDVSDRFTVLRSGRVVGTVPAGSVAEESLVEMMLGKQRLLPARQALRDRSSTRLRTRSLSVGLGGTGRRALHEIDLSIAGGEIVGVAGVDGNGQRELAEVLVGLRRISGGSVQLDGRTLGSSVLSVRRQGVAWIPEDRSTTGLVGGFTVAENLMLGRQRDAAFRRRWLIDRKKVRKSAQDQIADFDVRPADPDARASSLSGGNQQKLVVARALSVGEVKLLVASEPTRGLDVEASAAVHEQIRGVRDAGGAVLLISANLDELRDMSNRIVVMFKGAIAGSGAPDILSDAELGLLMTAGRSTN